MRESKYKRELKERLSDLFPGCLFLDNDPTKIQGIPDLLILYGNTWAMLEVKTSSDANIQPNQPYYVDLLNSYSFAAFVYPENEEEVLYELQQTFGIIR